MTKKLYCYVDETGQDTNGVFFLVIVFLKDKDSLTAIENFLIELESTSKKGVQKWNKTRPEIRTEYLKGLLSCKSLTRSIYFSKYAETKEYVSLTALTIAKSILKTVNQAEKYEAIVTIDGLNNKERDRVRDELKKLKIRYNKIRGMKDEQNVFLRLADTMAGFIRDHTEERKSAGELFRKFFAKQIIAEI